MSRHIILEVRGLSGAVTGPGPRGPREGYSGDGEARAGILAGGLTSVSFKGAYTAWRQAKTNYTTTQRSLNTAMGLQGLQSGIELGLFGKDLTRDQKIQMLKNAYNTTAIQEVKDVLESYGVDTKNMPIENVAPALVPYLGKEKDKVSAAKAAIGPTIGPAIQKQVLPKASIAIAYANQVYGLVTAHYQNTYKMSGMTTASLRLKRQQDVVNISRDIAGIGIAFAINPILGLAQTAMTVAQKAINLHEQTREYNFNQAKERYTSNYYRSRLVNNTKVVL